MQKLHNHWFGVSWHCIRNKCSRVLAIAAHDPASEQVAKDLAVPQAGDSAMVKHRGICNLASR
jgi:hypothetical protein